MLTTLEIKTPGQALIDITGKLNQIVAQAKLNQGLCTLMVQHTSASLIVQENADPAVQTDLLNWFNRLVAENDPLYSHTAEGPDDMPAHIKNVLTQTSMSIPFDDNRLCLGVWQAIYLWEHRRHAHRRSIVIHLA